MNNASQNKWIYLVDITHRHMLLTSLFEPFPAMQQQTKACAAYLSTL